MTRRLDRLKNLLHSQNHLVSPAAPCCAAGLLLILALGLAGCGSHATSIPAPGSIFMGSVIGGQQPVTGGTVQLFAVGTTGDGSAATPETSATLTTSDGTGQMNANANAGNLNNTLQAGYFTITGDYMCPSGSAEMYLVIKGGNPGLGLGNNPNLTLMTALGQCSTLTSSTAVVINELTTVSAVASLSNFMTSYANVGSGSTDASQLQGAFGAMNEYADINNGTVPGPTLPTGYNASSTALLTLGDIVSACINSAGGVAGDNSACGNLFSLATVGTNPAPTDTIGAVINILSQPTVNVPQIFAQLPSSPPFQTPLATSPANWELPISSNTATHLAFVTSPSNTAAGSSISPSVTVAIEDASNTVQASANNSITLAIGANPSSGTLSGATTLTAINGVATFSNVNINKSGNGYTLTANSTNLAGVTSGSFNITAGTASKLVFGTVPSPVSAGVAITPAVTVSVEDANSNVVTTSSAPVALSIGTNPASGSLSGTTTLNASSGVASFSNLIINNAGAGYTLSATSSGLTNGTSSAFTVAAPAIGVTATIVGNNFVTPLGLSLPSASPANEMMTLTSTDPTHFLLSTNQTTMGTASIQVPLTLGSQSIGASVYLQGQNYSGSAAITNTVTATAMGFSTGTGTMTLYPSGLGFDSASFSTTTFSSATNLTVGLLGLTPGTLTAAFQGTLGPQGASPSFTVTSGTPATGTITGNPASFTVGSSTYNSTTISFQPVAAGTSTLTLNQPTGYLASTSSNWPSQITATVSAPTITVSPTIVGNNFITGLNISLQSAPTTTESMTVTIADSTHFLLTTNPSMVGTASVTVTLTAGNGSVPAIYLEGQNYTGSTAITTMVTATATGYTTGTATQSLYPSGLGLDSSSFSTTTFSSPTNLTVGLLGLTPGTLTAAFQGTLGPQGMSPSFTITSGTPATGTITGNPASYIVNSSTYNATTISFTPVAAGTSTLTLNEPTGYVASSSSNWPTQITATVSAPNITVSANTVGNNFITGLSVGIQSAPSTAETMTITSNDPTHFLLSTSPTVVGSASVMVTLTPGNGSVPNIYLEGQNYSGTTAITALVSAVATGYTSGSGTQTLYPSGLGFATGSFNTTTFSSPTGLTVGLLGLTPGTLTASFQGTLGPQGVSPSFSLTSGTPATGTISGNPGNYTVNGGTYESNTVFFVPAASGTSTLTLTQPSGYVASTSSNWPSQITATVSAPTISVSPTIVGNEMVTSLGISVQAPPPTAETMTIISNDPTHFLLSTSPTAVGSASLMVTVATNGGVPTIYLEGQNFNNNATAWTTTVTASAAGYTGGSGMQSLYPSGLGFNTQSFSTTTSSSPTQLVVSLLVLDPTTLTAIQQPSLGPQAPTNMFTVTSNTPATGTISGAGSYNVDGGTYESPYITFIPAGVGTSTLTINQPSGFTAPNQAAWPTQITATVTQGP